MWFKSFDHCMTAGLHFRELSSMNEIPCLEGALVQLFCSQCEGDIGTKKLGIKHSKMAALKINPNYRDCPMRKPFAVSLILLNACC
jgi:hypothetical protein